MEERNVVEVDKPRKAKRKKSGYHLTDWSCRREKDYGPRYANKVALFPLPPVGTKVKVYIRENFERGRSLDKNVVSRYIPYDRCVDVFRRAITYTVVEYSMGIDKPLEKGNGVLLEAQVGNRLEQVWMSVLRVSIGYYYLKWDNGVSLPEYMAGCLYANEPMYVAEYSRTKCKKENEELVRKCLEAVDGPKKKYGD